MIHFNAELWNNHQLCVLQVLNVKETNPTKKIAKKLAKAKMSRHNLRMSQQKLKATSRAVSQESVICHNKDKAKLKLEVEILSRHFKTLLRHNMRRIY